MAERTTEEQASDNFRAEFEWLELFRAEDQVSLGCKNTVRPRQALQEESTKLETQPE